MLFDEKATVGVIMGVIKSGTWISVVILSL